MAPSKMLVYKWAVVMLLIEASKYAAAKPRIEAPCSACEAVAAELQKRIDK
jgi:hypothetical protein